MRFTEKSTFTHKPRFDGVKLVEERGRWVRWGSGAHTFPGSGTRTGAAAFPGLSREGYRVHHWGGGGQLMEESRPSFKSNIQHQCSYSIYFWNPSLLQLLSYTVHHSSIFYLYTTCVASRVYIYITEGKSYIKDFLCTYYTILCLSIIHFEKLQKSCVGTIICKPYYCSFGESLGVSKKLS